MQVLLKISAGILVRFVGMLSEQFAQWLFEEASEGSETLGESLSKMRHFLQWFLKNLAGQMCGRSRPHFGAYEDDYQGSYYGAR